jgi:histone-lysine N-methyltransferase SETMAR
LTDDQKLTRLDISRYLLSPNEDEPDFIYRIVTQDETWIHHFDPESKKQNMQWKHPGAPPTKKFKRVPSAGKVMTSIFWDSQEIVMIDYLEQGRTINGTYYADELRRLRQKIARKRRSKLTQGVLLLQYNAQAHISQVAIAAATDCGFEILPHPPYSLDFAPSDFYVFPKLKTSFVVDVLEAMMVSWRRSMSSSRTKIESSDLKG